jgi:hypothetical protein
MIEFLQIVKDLNALGGIAYVFIGTGGFVVMFLGKRWLKQHAEQHKARLKSDAAMQSELRNLSDLLLALFTREVANAMRGAEMAVEALATLDESPSESWAALPMLTTEN